MITDYTPTIKRIGRLSQTIAEKLNEGHPFDAVKYEKDELDLRINGLTDADHPALRKYGQAAKEGIEEGIKLQQMHAAGEPPRKIKRQRRKVSKKEKAIKKAAEDIGRHEREAIKWLS
ncbi:hypothetical protein [Salibacterium sp. K-3]